MMNPDSLGNYDQVRTNEDLESSLVPQTDEQYEVDAGLPMIEVVAPATLPEGFEFMANYGNTKVSVRVPPGGVEQNQKFMVPLPADVESSPVSIPVGHWRDEIYDMFNYGLCHPHLWTSFFCALLAGGQVIRRLNFTWQGTPAPDNRASASAFEIIVYITLVHYTVITISMLAQMTLDPNDYENDPPELWEEPTGLLAFVQNIAYLFHLIYWAITAYVLYHLRRSVRSKYAIPGRENKDCVLACFCSWFVSAQLLRHTTDYDRYPSQLCTPTGIPKHAPMIV